MSAPESGRAGAATPASHLAALHDALTRVGYAAAGGCLVVIAVSFWYEVVSRHFFSAPTEWASPLVSYSLCAMIFLALPELTRRAEHIAIGTFTDGLAPARARRVAAAVRLLAALACLFAAWFSASEALEQATQGIRTNPPFAVPKWVVSMWIPYGMLGAGLHFLRHLASGSAAAARGTGL